MDEELERLVIAVRADTRGFAGDVAGMRGLLEEQVGGGADAAGRAIERSLSRAVRQGKFGFDDLRRTALSALGEIAAGAVRSGGIGGGLGSLVGGVLGALGLPGRATGGPVSPGRGYVVGERGPELFVPTASGRIETGGGGGARDIRVSINVTAAGEAGPQALARSGRQVAQAVRAALAESER